MANSSRQQRVREFIERHEWSPAAFFAGGPLIVFGVFYAFPQVVVARTCAVAGFLLFLGLVLYLFFFKREQTVSLGSSVPTIFGPLLATFFARQRSPELWAVVENGGASLIQLAFYFAGLLGLGIYHFTMLRTGPDHDTRVTAKRAASFIVFASLAAAPAWFGVFAPIKPPAGPSVFGIETPGLTPLTVCRLILALWSVLLATWPPENAAARIVDAKSTG